MRQLLIVLMIVSVPPGLILGGSSWGFGSETSTPARHIEHAAQVVLSDEHPGRAGVQEALAEMLLGATLIARSTDLPPLARERLTAAAAAFAEGGFLEPETRKTVHRAYEAVSGGRAFSFPEEVGSIEEAKEYGRHQIETALEARRTGRPKEAIVEIVGFVTLVITPRRRD